MPVTFFSSSNYSGSGDLIVREPAVAGSFYPGSKKALYEMLEGLFENVSAPKESNIQAIVVPHAGYVYSGQVAANAFYQIDPEKEYDRIFIIGSSHWVHFDGASVYNIGNYLTPLGVVDVDLETAGDLIKNNQEFSYHPDAHKQEHSLEVQLPFLQYRLRKYFKIVPVIIGTQSEKTIHAISKALKPFYNDRNLFVISSDFSHYPDYHSANKTDEITAKAIAANSPSHFLNTLDRNAKQGISGLATSMCGWTSMLVVLNITQSLPQIKISPIFYRNSGDAKFGDKSRVVGYWAITVSNSDNNEQNFNLSLEEKELLLSLARKTLIEYLKTGKPGKPEKQNHSRMLNMNVGAFVSVYCDGQLRGCIGQFNPQKSLYDSIRKLAVSAAFNDRRFKPLAAEEIEKTNIEISVLTPLKKIHSLEEIEPGKHGIYIKKGLATGTFLPQVAQNRNWSVEELLGYCARDKANIGWDGWRDAEIFIYQAIVFSDE
jgi:MEMO1 family protein